MSESIKEQERGEMSSEIKAENLNDNEQQNEQTPEDTITGSCNELNLDELKKLSTEELLKMYQKTVNEKNELQTENEKLSNLVKQKEDESKDYLDKYTRGLAEVENVRKRSQADRQEFAKYANFKIIEDLLNILDDFQRAIDSAKAGNIDFENYQQGIEMIEKQFLDLLFKKYGVVKFGEAGEEFDPNRYQGMMLEEGDFETEVVTEVFRSGYTLHERVIRPAQVKVGKPK